jgi:hypothetical protein
MERSRRDESLIIHILTGLSMGLGALSKEIVLASSLYVVLVFAYDIFSKNRSAMDGLSKIFIIGFFAAIFPGLWSFQSGKNLAVYFRFAVYGASQTYSLPYEHIYPIETAIISQYGAHLPVIIKHLLHYILSFGGAFWLTLPFVPSGISKARNEGKILKSFFLFLPLAIVIALRPYIERRRAFILFPFIIPLGVSGIIAFFNKYEKGKLMKIILAVFYIITTNIIFLLAPGYLK